MRQPVPGVYRDDQVSDPDAECGRLFGIAALVVGLVDACLAWVRRKLWREG